MNMDKTKIKGTSTEYEFKVFYLKDIDNLKFLNCIAIVAYYKKPNIFSMFYIEHFDSIKSLKNIFDLQLGHLLFIRELSEFEDKHRIINDIKTSNPEHEFDK